MKIKEVLGKALGIFLVMTIVCGVMYTIFLTAIGQLAFNKKANGSIIEVNGKKYGSYLMGQQFEGEEYMWGRIMNIDVSTFTDKNGEPLMYAGPSNLSPASEEYKELVAARVEKLKAAHKGTSSEGKPVPVELVTCSGSGLDPEISVNAANYQAERIAKARNISVDQVEKIIEKCTNGKFLGVFGEKTVNVLEVNLMLDNILK